MNSNALDKVLTSDLCTGCGLCTSIFKDEKIKMDFDQNGFYRPVINNREVYDRMDGESLDLFKKVCPGYIVDHSILKKEILQKDDPVWGKSLEIFIGYANDNKVRYKGSSGGIITALSSYLLEKKIVDGVIQIGVTSERPLRNEAFLSTTPEEVIERAGSRYSPSAPLSDLGELLERPLTYAFVGKPCDVAALRSYEKEDSRVKQKIKYMFSFFCAGVPSMKGTDKILKYFDIKEDEVSSFRYRGEGWPGYTTVVTNTGKKYQMTYDDSWGKVLNRHLQKRCKICIDGIGEFADISCGDAWVGDEKGYPTFVESEGRNVVIVRNHKGKELIDQLIKDHYIIKVSKTDENYLDKIQPYQVNRRQQLLSRIIALRLFLKPTPKYNRKIMVRSALRNKMKSNIRGFAGSVIRILKGRM